MTEEQELMIERRKAELLDGIDDLEDDTMWDDRYGHAAAAHIESMQEEMKFLDRLLAADEQ